MARFNSIVITTLSCVTGIMTLSATAVQADEVRWNCGNRFGSSTTVSLNSGGDVQLSTSDWRTWARAAESGCRRVETEPSPSPRIYVNTTPSRVYVEPAEASVPAPSSITVNPDPYPAALW